MLVWLGVIRYLGFFQKYNVRISWDLRAVGIYSVCCYKTTGRNSWLNSNFSALLCAASHPNTASSITQCNEVLLLRCYDLPGLLLLWMDCTGTIPCEGNILNMKKDNLNNRLDSKQKRDYYCCLLSFHVKTSLNIKIVPLQQDAALFEESDFHDSIRLSSSYESSESEVEAAMTPNHMLVFREIIYHLAEHQCQTRALETLSLSLLKGKLAYLN